MMKQMLAILILASCGSRGKKDNTILQSADSIKIDTTNHQYKNRPDSSFLLFWNRFKEVVANHEIGKLKAMSLDSLDCGQDSKDKFIHINKFIQSYYIKAFDSVTISKFSSDDAIDFVDSGMDSTFFPPRIVKLFVTKKYVIREVNIHKADRTAEDVIISVRFIETKKGYRFYAYNRYG